MRTAPFNNPSLPAIISLFVVVLLLITCVALLVLALAMTATKLKSLRAEKRHTDPPHYYNQIGGGDWITTHEICSEVLEGTDSTDGQRGLYQELERKTMEEGQYQVLNTSKV